MKNGIPSRERIITAAKEVFAEKGKHGASMEEIADRAEINKAMIYYYYSTKDSLFRTVLVTIFRRIYDRVFEILGANPDAGTDQAEKVVRLTEAHLTAFSEDVHFARIFLHALANEPQALRAAVRDIRGQEETSQDEASGPRLPEALLPAVQEGILKKEFRESDASCILGSIIGMSLINFIRKPIAEILLGQKIKNTETFLKEREKSTVELLLHGVVADSVLKRRSRGEQKSGQATRKEVTRSVQSPPSVRGAMRRSGTSK